MVISEYSASVFNPSAIVDVEKSSTVILSLLFAAKALSLFWEGLFMHELLLNRDWKSAPSLTEIVFLRFEEEDFD